LAVASWEALSASPLCSFGFTTARYAQLRRPSPLLETEAAVITSAGNAAAAPAASVAAEIGTIAQFSGVA
jgi:hypothetical protein